VECIKSFIKIGKYNFFSWGGKVLLLHVP
jgi:hypothetical protein